jgi:hypothetical protein
MAVGALSMLVPMFNAELAPPGIRGSLVALQQLAITFGIVSPSSGQPTCGVLTVRWFRTGSDMAP